MEALNTLVKQFQDGAILTNEELNQIVSYINQIVEYINNNIKPAIENGIQGKNGRDGVDGRDGRDGIEGISSAEILSQGYQDGKLVVRVKLNPSIYKSKQFIYSSSFTKKEKVGGG